MGRRSLKLYGSVEGLNPVCCLHECWPRVLEGGFKKGTLGGARRPGRAKAGHCWQVSETGKLKFLGGIHRRLHFFFSESVADLKSIQLC